MGSSGVTESRALHSENLGIGLHHTSHMILEMSSTAKQVIIPNILKAITVLCIHLIALHVIACLKFTTGMRISTINHILQGKLKHGGLTSKIS